MQPTKIQLRKTLKPLMLIAILAAFLIVGLPVITDGSFKDRVAEWGAWGPVAIVLYTAASHVLAPLAGTPAVLVAFALYGVWVGVLLLYVSSMLSGLLCFWISRWYGRELVKRLAGAENLQQIDDLTQHVGRKFLVLTRIFGAPVFEVVSYAAGLTNMRFRDYMLITLVASIPPNVLNAWLFRQADFTSPRAHLIWLAMIMTSALVFAAILAKLFFPEKNSMIQNIKLYS